MMEKTLVLCVLEVVSRYGSSTYRYQDSVMLTGIEFRDQVLPCLSFHMNGRKTKDPSIIDWELTMYLPRTSLKAGRRTLN